MPFQIVSNVTLASAATTIGSLIGQPIGADPAGNTDPLVTQIITALNQAASELYAVRDWQELRSTFNLPVVADSSGQREKFFDLPEDYGRFVDSTQWSTSQRWPCLGPITAKNWATLLNMPALPVATIYWQIRNDKLVVMAPPFPDPLPMFAYYISRGFITDQDDPTIYKNIATKNGDTFLLDGQLITLLGRLKWLEYKGFDTAAAARDYQVQFDSRAGSDEGAMIMSLTASNVGINMPLISGVNLPITGYGS